MKPEEQKTIEVLERIYSHLIRVKEKKNTICYSDLFAPGFETRYESKYCYIICQRRGVKNNIPYILGAIGRACNAFKLPPLCCLVVNKSTRKCGGNVIISKSDVPKEEYPEFAEKVDRPAVYACNNYPQTGTQRANDLLRYAMDHLRKIGLAVE
jgi:hypothetical protein